MRIGYAHALAEPADLHDQIARLRRAGCEFVIVDEVAQTVNDIPGRLAAFVAIMRADQTLAICSLQGVRWTRPAFMALTRVLAEKQASLVALEDRLDTSDLFGRLLFQMVTAFLDYEQLLCAELRIPLSPARGPARGGSAMMALWRLSDETFRDLARQYGKPTRTVLYAARRQRAGLIALPERRATQS